MSAGSIILNFIYVKLRLAVLKKKKKKKLNSKNIDKVALISFEPLCDLSTGSAHDS